MSISRSMSGSPWHAEKMTRAEGDERRYKGRCEYYSYDTGICSRQKFRCPGSAHCDCYKQISEEEFKKRQAASQKKNPKNAGTDDCYWY